MKAFYSTSIIALLITVLIGCSENSKKNQLSENEKFVGVSVEIPIEGMSCMSCVANVKKTLSDLEGVSEVKVSLENKKTTLHYNPQKISLDTIQQTINKIGYKAGKPQELKE